jgi:hypothetical protein
MLVVSGQTNCHDTDNSYTFGQPSVWQLIMQLVFFSSR